MMKTTSGRIAVDVWILAESATLKYIQYMNPLLITKIKDSLSQAKITMST